MTGAWRSGLQFSAAQALGGNAGTSQGTSINGNNSSTFTKSAWTQLIASTTTDSAWMLVTLETQNSGGKQLVADIGYGGIGSEVVLAGNLSCSGIGATGVQYMLPLAIPAGTRISARISNDQLFDATPIQVLTFADTYFSAGTGQALDTYGFSAATNLGVAIDPGATANTKGSYSTIIASMTNDISGFLLCFDTQGTGGSVGPITWLIDLAIGAAASEQIILPNLFLAGNVSSGFAQLYHQVTPYIAMQIAAGTRVAVRAQCSTNTTPDRTLGVTFYGVRQ